jgi:hypothetical protein
MKKKQISPLRCEMTKFEGVNLLRGLRFHDLIRTDVVRAYARISHSSHQNCLAVWHITAMNGAPRSCGQFYHLTSDI